MLRNIFLPATPVFFQNGKLIFTYPLLQQYHGFIPFCSCKSPFFVLLDLKSIKTKLTHFSFIYNKMIFQHV